MLVSINTIHLVGNIAKDVEISMTRRGIPVANLVVVTVASWVDSAGTTHEESTFTPVECFGATAEWCGRELSPGSRVAVTGRLRQVSWGHEPQKKSKMLVSAEHVFAIR